MTPNEWLPVLAVFAGLLAFSEACAWVHRASRRPHGRVVAFLERLRKSAAYED